MDYDVELLSSTRRVVAESLWKHDRYVARPAREGLLVFEHRRGVVSPATERLSTEAACILGDPGTKRPDRRDIAHCELLHRDTGR